MKALRGGEDEVFSGWDRGMEETGDSMRELRDWKAQGAAALLMLNHDIPVLAVSRESADSKSAG